MKILEIAKKIESLGGRLYLVGGSLRDEIMGKQNHDEDYCVTGITFGEFLRSFSPELMLEENRFRFLI